MNLFGKYSETSSTSKPKESTSATQLENSDADDGLECVTIAKDTTDGDPQQQQERTTDNDEETPSDNRKNSLTAEPFLRIVSTVLPKVEPLPWSTFFCLSIWCTVP